jgi:serine/threonine protein kinase
MDGEELRFYKFLEYYKLEQYHEEFVKMGVKQIAHLRDVNDGDLTDIGMSGPEKVRLSRKMNENFSMMGRLVKRLKRKDGRFNTQESTRRRHGALKMQQSAVKESKTPIIFAIENVNLGKKLGDGANGEVHEAQLLVPQHEAVIVAAKTIYRKDKGPSIEEMFLKEVQSMFELNHDHIIKLYGMVLGNPLILVEELAPLGNLLSYIKNNPVHLGLIHTYAVQLADAMEYLEFNKIIHRDLAARNVLLINEQHVKLSDFGLARKLQEDDEIYQHSNYDVPLPTAWLAPEALKKGEFSSASDVWSYGVLLWELTSLGGRPWEGIPPRDLLGRLEGGIKLSRPRLCYPKMYEVMMVCWELDKNKRPAFNEINKLLQMPNYSPGKATVIRTHQSDRQELKKDEVLYIVRQLEDQGWWLGMTRKGQVVSFESNNVTFGSDKQQQQQQGTVPLDIVEKYARIDRPNEPLQYDYITANAEIYIEDTYLKLESIRSQNEMMEDTFDDRRRLTASIVSDDFKSMVSTHSPRGVNTLPPSGMEDGLYEQLPSDSSTEEDDLYDDVLPIQAPPPPAQIIHEDNNGDSDGDDDDIDHLPPPAYASKKEFMEALQQYNKEKITHSVSHPPQPPIPNRQISPPIPPRSNKQRLPPPLTPPPPIPRRQISPLPPPPIPHRPIHLPEPLPVSPTYDELGPHHGYHNNPTPPPDPPPRQPAPHHRRGGGTVINARQYELPERTRAMTTAGSQGDSLWALKREFPDLKDDALYDSLMKNNGNIDMAIDDVKVEQLMGFGLEYITREDCHRALRHCGGKVDRAGTWLLEQNDTISSRRNS